MGIVSIAFVLLSIFTFAAETHPYFRGEPYDDTDTCHTPILYCTPLPEVTTAHAPAVSMYTENASRSDNATAEATTAYLEETQTREKYDTAIESFLVGWMDYPSVTLGVMDLICYSFFTAEVLLRLVFCPNLRRFFRSGFNIVDVLSVVLFYIEVIINVFQSSVSEQRPLLEALFILRLLRIFRVFRLVRHHRGLQVLVYTLRASVREIFLLVVFLAIGVLLFGSLIYYADGDNHLIKSIPHGLWWAIVTMTTVGYGDVVPCNTWGKIVGATCAICGLLMIAFTAPVIVNNFMLFYHQVQFGKKPDQPKSHASARPSIVWPFTSHDLPEMPEEEEPETDDSKLGAGLTSSNPGIEVINSISTHHNCDGIAQCDGLHKSSVHHLCDGLLKADRTDMGEEETAMVGTSSAPNSPPPETPPPNYYSMTFQTYI